jgi:hypothetical protein
MLVWINTGLSTVLDDDSSWITITEHLLGLSEYPS